MPSAVNKAVFGWSQALVRGQGPRNIFNPAAISIHGVHSHPPRKSWGARLHRRLAGCGEGRLIELPCEDATWDELKLTVREHSMLAEIRGARHEFGFDDLGMSGSGDRLWGLLCAFARLNGRLPGVSRDSKEIEPATFRKQVSDLRHLLSTVFPITGKPIPAVRGAGGYRTLFHISLDRRDGFPVQPERWDACCFTELRDGRIAISVRTKEVSAARTRDGETQRLTATEAGERDGLRSEIYDLRTLGLGSESGRPTSEGRVFVALLRAGGKLYRRGDDKDILRLGERLRRWMGVDSGPFQFAPSRRLWTATFECGTEPER